MSESTVTSEDDDEIDILIKRGNLFKWTNYLSGWQVRLSKKFHFWANFNFVFLFFLKPKCPLVPLCGDRAWDIVILSKWVRYGVWMSRSYSSREDRNYGAWIRPAPFRPFTFGRNILVFSVRACFKSILRKFNLPNVNFDVWQKKTIDFDFWIFLPKILLKEFYYLNVKASS